MLKLKIILISFCLSACSNMHQRPDEQLSSSKAAKPHTLYIIRHSWHTGIVLTQQMLGDELAFLKPIFANKTYYEFGWGHRAFYRARNGTVSLYLRSALLPSPTVMHVAASDQEPRLAYEQDKIVALRVTEAGLKKLRQGLADSFTRDVQGLSIQIEKGLYGDSYFFEGVGTYTTFGNTCNTWTARMLKKADTQVRTFMSVTADGVMTQVRELPD